MKAKVRYCFVQINDIFYYSPKLAALHERCVEVSVWFDESVDVYANGEFICEAVRLNTPATSPMSCRENGRIVGRRMRRSAHYPMTDEFPPVPEAYRCRSAIRSDDSLWREMRRTARSYHRLNRSETQSKQFEKILSAFMEAHVEEMAMLKKLDEFIQELRG